MLFGGRSEVQNTLPFVEGRGMLGPEEAGRTVFEAGVEDVEKSVVKCTAEGPKGVNGWMVVDGRRVDVPVVVWEVVRRVGCGRVFGVGDDIAIYKWCWDEDVSEIELDMGKTNWMRWRMGIPKRRQAEYLYLSPTG